ncbi:MAG: aminotransferase class III-fold pyridoxal phosphate-dependent enzyme [Candidatus Limnocylindrales bacterium]|jgi:adenosylmethionine-8-amino-7-oxononanoate aminotransferase
MSLRDRTRVGAGVGATVTGRVFQRVIGRDLPVAARAEGCTIWDTEGRAYLDAAGGAVVVNVGHGRQSVVDAMARQAGAFTYVHGTTFTSEPLESYARAVARYLPVDDPAIYPVSGGSEAIESCLKLARAYHLARREPDRTAVIARWGSYHGNSMGALDLSGREPLRRPYEPWLGRFDHVSAAYPYRAGEAAAHALGDVDRLVAELEAAIAAAGEGRVAAFVAEPIVGATLGAVAPPDGYWPAVAEVCRRHGVLLVADEVMTGFGRTGRWFGMDHWGVRADVMAAAKGAAGGYFPFGLAVASGQVYETVTAAGGFVHGFTYSHSPVGAAAAGEVLRILETEKLVEASAVKGARLKGLLADRLGGHRNVGEIRGRGLMVGLELVADRATRRPFPRSARLIEAVMVQARAAGLLMYHGTGNADGTNGDTILLGPPFVITDVELARCVEIVGGAVEKACAEVAPGPG